MLRIQVQITAHGPVYYVTDRWGMVQFTTTDKQTALAAIQKEADHV